MARPRSATALRWATPRRRKIVRKLRYYGDPALRKACRPVEEFGPWLKELAADMLHVCREADGLGLAAPQVGETVRMVIIDLYPLDPGMETLYLCNPEILETRGEQIGSEGCLSFPGIFEDVPRPDWVRYRYQDLDGVERTSEAKGLIARAICHEIDHLNGVLLVDNISLVRRQFLRSELKKIQRGEIDAPKRT